MNAHELPIASQESETVEHERRPGMSHSVYIVMMVTYDTPAKKAGLEIGDEILSMDASPATSGGDWFVHARKSADQPMLLKVRRDGTEIDLTLVQEYLPDEDRYYAGFEFRSETRPNETIEMVEAGDRVVLRHRGKMYQADGKEQCSYQYDLDTETNLKRLQPENVFADRARRLRSFVLRTPEDETKEIDLLSRFNSTDTPVYVMLSRNSENAGIHDSLRDQVILQSMTGSATDVHVLLHELRHAQQESDPKSSLLRPYYGFERIDSVAGRALAKQWRDTAYDGFIINLARMVEIVGLTGLNKGLGRLKGEIQTIREASSTYEEFRANVLKTEVGTGVTVWDLLMLPRRMLERDAEFGALSAERTIRHETGIDLFGLYRDFEKEDRSRQEGRRVLDQLRASKEISEMDQGKIEEVFEKKFKQLAEEGLTLSVLQAVRGYMASIGATPGMIRKYLEVGEKKDA